MPRFFCFVLWGLIGARLEFPFVRPLSLIGQGQERRSRRQFYLQGSLICFRGHWKGTRKVEGHSQQRGQVCGSTQPEGGKDRTWIGNNEEQGRIHKSSRNRRWCLARGWRAACQTWRLVIIIIISMYDINYFNIERKTTEKKNRTLMIVKKLKNYFRMNSLFIYFFFFI